MLHGSFCESPAEERFMQALRRHGAVLGEIEQQREIYTGRALYRVDFAAVRVAGIHRLQVAIEVDGHEWHEKDLRRAAEDKRRDRDLLTAGWLPMRFTASEVASDPDLCVLEVCGAMIAWIDRLTCGEGVRGGTEESP